MNSAYEILDEYDFYDDLMNAMDQDSEDIQLFRYMLALRGHDELGDLIRDDDITDALRKLSDDELILYLEKRYDADISRVGHFDMQVNSVKYEERGRDFLESFFAMFD